MLEDHAAAQAEYEERWARETALLPYSKPSPELLQLRKMQKALAIAKRFPEAKAVKEKADGMQAAEARAGEIRAKASIRAGFEALKERQQRAIECFEEHERRSITFVEQERARAIESIVMVIRTLETACERIAERKESRGEHPVKVGTITPRARTALREFCANDEPERLRLDAQAVRRFAAQKRERIVVERA
jgi:hypothetical protein